MTSRGIEFMTKFNENTFVEYHSDLNKVIFNGFKDNFIFFYM
ncbi:hypothetical protein ACUXFU_001985 [Staphylococcus saprophyticus]|jgi:hypothetical protein|nr:hypothetical protein SEQMU2_12690 [Staphylococcus equorum subsp. equorum Mu2]